MVRTEVQANDLVKNIHAHEKELRKQGLSHEDIASSINSKFKTLICQSKFQLQLLI